MIFDIRVLEQISLAHTAYNLVTKHSHKHEFLHDMNLEIPCTELRAPFEQNESAVKIVRALFAREVMLPIHLRQQFLGHSDAAMQEALHDIPLCREFSHLDAGITHLPDESTSLRVHDLYEEHGLAQQILAAVNAKKIDLGLMSKTGTVVYATLISAYGSTKNDKGERDPEMHQVKKDNQGHIGRKAYIGVDAYSCLVHTVTSTAVNDQVITQAAALLHGQVEVVAADTGHKGIEKRDEV